MSRIWTASRPKSNNQNSGGTNFGVGGWPLYLAPTVRRPTGAEIRGRPRKMARFPRPKTKNVSVFPLQFRSGVIN